MEKKKLPWWFKINKNIRPHTSFRNAIVGIMRTCYKLEFIEYEDALAIRNVQVQELANSVGEK